MNKKTLHRFMVFFLSAIAFCCTIIGLSAQSTQAEEKLPTSIKIEIDALGYNSYDLPFGVVGETYPVFDCTAKDNLGGVVSAIDVFVLDPLGNGVSLTDGRFSTDVVGDYKIVYTATKGGLFAQRELTVSVKSQDEYSNIDFVISDDMVENAYTGSKVYLYDGKLTGGFGFVDSKMEIIYSGNYSCDEIIIYDYDIPFFCPQVSGIYTLIYTFTDVTLTTAEFTHQIIVTDDNVPVIKMPSLSKIYHVGEKIEFPEAEALIYYQGNVILIPVKVTVKQGDSSIDVSDTLTFTPEQAGEYTFTYFAENPFVAGKSVSYSVDVQVIVLNDGQKTPYIQKYLYSNGFTSAYRGTDGEQGYEQRVFVLYADGTVANPEISFKGKLPLEYASIKFGVETKNFNYDGVKVCFVDSENSNQKVELVFKANDKKGVDAYMNSTYITTFSTQSFLEGASNNASSIDVNINYADNTFYSNLGGANLGKPKTYLNGDEYVGFTSGKVYVSLSAVNAKADSQIKLYEIATQKISGAIVDGIQPVMSLGGFTAAYTTDLGFSVVLPKLDVFDLYDDSPTLNLSIVSPSGQTVFSGKMDKDYLLTVKEIGNYEFTYTATDSSGKENELIGSIKVLDRTAPNIELSGIINGVSVGQTVEFPSAVITDESENLTTWIYVTRDDFFKETLTGKSYTFDKSGVYTITYGAMDLNGNRTVVSYKVICR